MHFKQFGEVAKVVAVHAAQKLIEVVPAPPMAASIAHAPLGIGAGFAGRTPARLAAKPDDAQSPRGSTRLRRRPPARQLRKAGVQRVVSHAVRGSATRRGPKCRPFMFPVWRPGFGRGGGSGCDWSGK